MRLSCWNNQKIPYPLAEKYPGVSSYTYCVNNPVNLVDPDGLFPILINGRVRKAISFFVEYAIETFIGAVHNAYKTFIDKDNVKSVDIFNAITSSLISVGIDKIVGNAKFMKKISSRYEKTADKLIDTKLTIANSKAYQSGKTRVVNRLNKRLAKHSDNYNKASYLYLAISNLSGIPSQVGGNVFGNNKEINLLLTRPVEGEHKTVTIAPRGTIRAKIHQSGN